MHYLRQSTAATVEIGPFIGIDGLTEQTALTSQTGRYVAGGTSASFTGTSWSHTANGNYAVGFSTTHTGTVGRLRLVFQSSGTYLPVWHDYVVLSAAVYDALFGSNALSTHTAANVAALVLATPANLLATDASGRVQVQVGTAAGQINSSSGKVPATLASTDVTGNVAADLQTIKTQAVTCAAGVTVPALIASTTNITAGTITTATNLTNAPTSGDFTTAMKTSLNAATPASVVGSVGSVAGSVASVTGNVGGSVGSIAGVTFPTNFSALAITATTGKVTVGTNSDKTGYSISGTKTTLDALNDYAGGDTTGTTTLLARLTSTRAGYLDNLSGGAVALATQIPANFTSATFASAGVFATAALANAPTGGGTAQSGDVYALVNPLISAGAIAANVTAWLGGTPNALVAGKVDANATASLGTTAPAGWINSAAFAAGATLPRVTLVDTCTTNTDMRGTNNAMLAASYTAPDNASITAIKTVTDKLNTTLQTDGGTGYQFTVLSLANAPSGTGGGLTLSGLQGELDTRGLTSTLTTTISTNLDAKVSGRAAPGAAMTLTTAYDAAKTAAPTASAVAAAVRDVNNTAPAASSLGAAVNTASSGGLNQQAVIDGVVSGVASAGVSLDMTQAVPLSNTANTVGDCLNAARAQGFGKWSKVGANLTLYAADGSTPVRSFVLDDAVSPTSRA